MRHAFRSIARRWRTAAPRRARPYLLLLSALLFGACGPAPAPPTPTPAPTAPPTAVPRPTAPPPVTAIPEPSVTPAALVLWAVARDQQLAALQALVAEWSRQSGTEIVVIGKSADALQADLRANMLSGLTPPDLLLGSQDDLGILQRADLLQPADDGLDDGSFIPATIAGATVDQRRWGTPLAAQGFLLLLYNRRLVDRPPRTTDELIARSRQLVADDRYGLVSGWAEPRWFVAWLSGFGGAARAPDGAPSLDTPQVVAALNLLIELRAAGPPSPSTYAEGAALFSEGRAAFAIDGDWALPAYRQYTQTLDLGIAPLPIVPATGRVAAPPLGATYLMHTKARSGARLAQARALGVALAQPGAQVQLARGLGQLPALRAALADPALAEDPALAAAAAQLDGAAGLPPDQGLRCAWQAIAAELPPVLMSQTTQEEAAQLMQASAMNCMAGPP